MAADAGWNGKVEISTDGGSTFSELANVSSASFSGPPNEADASVFNDEGIRRKYLQFDATVSTEFYFDFTEATHTQVLDAVLNETSVTVRVYPDRSAASKYFEAVCLAFPGDADFSVGSLDTMPCDFQNSDGNKWSYTNA